MYIQIDNIYFLCVSRLILFDNKKISKLVSNIVSNKNIFCGVWLLGSFRCCCCGRVVGVCRPAVIISPLVFFVPADPTTPNFARAFFLYLSILQVEKSIKNDLKKK